MEWIPEPRKLPGWRELVQRGCCSWRWSCSTRAWRRCRATRQRPSSPGTGRTRRSLPQQLAAGDVFDLKTILIRSYFLRKANSTYWWKIELHGIYSSKSIHLCIVLISTLLNQSLATSKLFLKTRLQGGSFRNSFAVDSRVLRKLIKLKGLAKKIPKENEKRELCKVTYFK